MLFNSWSFLLLVAVTASLHYLPPLRRLQVPVLIAASFVFYAYGQPALLALLVASILINTATSYAVAQPSPLATRRLWVTVGVTANLLVIALFKYGGLIGQSLGLAADDPGSIGALLISLPLPIGISFYTFQGISLLLDTWSETRAVDDSRPHCPTGTKPFSRHLLHTTFFIAFFPQLVAGPIVKARDFYPQIQPKRARDIAWDHVVATLVLGYFLKMVVADNLRDQTFWMTYPYFTARSSLDLIALLGAYGIQIFADFAGYSLIAIGIGALFGYRLPQNFNFPYLADSIAAFWHRWHISLSSWLREYLYIPLGGNRRGRARTYLNLLLVMALGGLWHGAAWSYLVWGCYHGLGLCLERLIVGDKPARDAIVPKPLRIAGVFLFVSLGWLLFRLPEFSEVLAYLGSMVGNWAAPADTVLQSYILLYTLPVVIWHAGHVWTQRRQRPLPVAWRTVGLGLCLFAIVTNPGSPEAFIYFQF